MNVYAIPKFACPYTRMQLVGNMGKFPSRRTVYAEGRIYGNFLHVRRLSLWLSGSKRLVSRERSRKIQIRTLPSVVFTALYFVRVLRAHPEHTRDVRRW